MRCVVCSGTDHAYQRDGVCPRKNAVRGFEGIRHRQAVTVRTVGADVRFPSFTRHERTGLLHVSTARGPACRKAMDLDPLLVCGACAIIVASAVGAYNP